MRRPASRAREWPRPPDFRLEKAPRAGRKFHAVVGVGEAAEHVVPARGLPVRAERRANPCGFDPGAARRRGYISRSRDVVRAKPPPDVLVEGKIQPGIHLEARGLVGRPDGGAIGLVRSSSSREPGPSGCVGRREAPLGGSGVREAKQQVGQGLVEGSPGRVLLREREPPRLGLGFRLGVRIGVRVVELAEIVGGKVPVRDACFGAFREGPRDRAGIDGKPVLPDPDIERAVGGFDRIPVIVQDDARHPIVQHYAVHNDGGFAAVVDDPAVVEDRPHPAAVEGHVHEQLGCASRHVPCPNRNTGVRPDGSLRPDMDFAPACEIDTCGIPGATEHFTVNPNRMLAVPVIIEQL